MPIRINLFHEEERALRERQRDPLKLGLLGCLLLLLGLVVYWTVLSSTLSTKRSEVATLRADWEKRRESSEQGEAKIAEMTTKIEGLELLDKRIAGRVFWAPVLQQLLEGARRDVQLTEVSGTTGQEGNLRLAVQGVTAGQEPRAVAEYLRTALENALKTVHPETVARFENLEENLQPIEIYGRQYRNARFLIDCRMVSSAASLKKDPPPAPAPRRQNN